MSMTGQVSRPGHSGAGRFALLVDRTNFTLGITNGSPRQSALTIARLAYRRLTWPWDEDSMKLFSESCSPSPDRYR